MQQFFLRSGNSEIFEALSSNKNLKQSIIEEFLKDEKLGANVAKNIKLTDELFKLLGAHKTALALNESLTLQMQEQLLEYGDDGTLYALALNDNIDEKILNQLLKSTNENIKSALYQNRSTPVSILEEAYKNALYCQEIAKNENTPVEILYQLHLDSRYTRAVMQNPTFGRHIQQENIGWEV